MNDDTPGASVPVESILWSLRTQLPMFIIYDHPSDHPTQFVGRLWVSLPRLEMTPVLLGADTLEPLQQEMRRIGLTKLSRSEGDDPVILETWI